MKVIKRGVAFLNFKMWNLLSYIPKKRFESGSVLTYRYCSEIFCNGKEAFDDVVKKCNEVAESYWEKQNEYNLSNYFGSRYKKREKMIFEDFLPLFGEKPDLVDVGCANGEWTSRVAKRCHSIDGYEYSQKMVHYAQEKWKDISNIHFYQGDVKEIKLEREYDGAMMLGLLMYIDRRENLLKVLQKIYQHIKPGGFLLVNDTLNCEGKDVVFLFNKDTGYNAVYWSKEIYYQQFIKAGFILYSEYLMEEVTTRRMHFVGQGTIWVKTRLEKH